MVKKTWKSAGRFLLCLSLVTAFGLQSASGIRGEEVKVMTANLVSGGWPNINYYSNSRRIFQGLDPDIVLIQEFRVQSPATRRSYVDDVFGTDFFLYYGSGGSPNGIISRWPFKSSGEWDDPELSDREFSWAVIDIPGDIDLQVVSVHLKASSGPAERETRRLEATQIEAYVQANFDGDHYILVGGDLNTYHSPVEPCLAVFASFLDYDDHTPADRNGNSDTNEGRNERYDWIMPNHLLNELHTTTTVGTQQRSYPEGIVFDSWVFPNVASEVPPVLYNDSHGTMDHMAVMKSYELYEHVPIVEEGFDGFQTGVRPVGWTFSGCDQDSDALTDVGDWGVAPPSIKLDATDDSITTALFANPTSLTFWVRGIGTDATSSLLIENHYGISWSALSTLNDLTTQGKPVGPFDLIRETDQLRFTYTKSNGNVALDDVTVLGITPPPTNTPTPPPPVPPIPPPTATPPAAPTATPPPTVTPVKTPTVSLPTPSPPPASQAPPWIYDYNGDGTSDIAIFRSGLWAIREVTRAYFGGSTSAPAPGDFDGDGTTDIAIFRAGLWAVRGVTRAYFGGSTSQPVPGDYDGNGMTDIGIFRSSSGLWAVRGGLRTYFGAAADIPVPGYYDGDGTEKIAVYRPLTGLWAIPGLTRVYFGAATDDPVPGDYAGSGSWAVGIYRPSSGLWAIRGVTRRYFGGNADWPVPADYAGTGADRIGIFRNSSGLWAVSGVTRVYFGSSGDIPVAR